MEFKKIAVADLKGAKYNPRKELKPGDAEFEKLKRSIEEFGYVEPIIYNEKTERVVGGHQRLNVLKSMGVAEVDCVVISLDETKEKALNIALNKINGEWDEPKLADLLKDLELQGYDTKLTGFDVKEMDELFSNVEYDAKEDDFDTTASEKPATTQEGDVWHLGRHKLLCGDSTDEKAVSGLFGNKKADLILTDPPYNVDYGTAEMERMEYAGGDVHDRKILNDKMDKESFDNFLFSFYKAAEKVAKSGGVIYVFHATKQAVAFMTQMQKAGFNLSQTLIWVKQHFTLGRSDYQWQFEPILYGWKEDGKQPHYFIHDRTLCTVLGEKADNTEELKGKSKAELVKILDGILSNNKSDILYDNRPVKSDEHPTMKPITLCARLIQNSSREKELVFDPFLGSGTTLMAAEQLNRTCFGIELAPNFCDVIVRRFIKMFGKDDVFLEREGKEIKLEDTKLSLD